MVNKKIIYALCCPFTNEIHYIGKTTQGMIRPLQHLSESHSIKVREWVDGLKEINYSPIIKILEQVSSEEDLDLKEKNWIQYYLSKKALLLNINSVSPILIKHDLEKLLGKGDLYIRIGKFVKEKRKKFKLTQEEFSSKAGVALSVIRKIEQCRHDYSLNSLIKVLKMFGCSIDICKL